MTQGYLEIVFNLPINQTFTYLALEPGNFFGRRVYASFGKRRLIGFVVGFRDEAPDEGYAIKPIDRVIDDEPLFDHNYLDLALWISDTYLCSLGEALSMMLPTGKEEREAASFGLSEVPEGRENISLSAEQEEAREAVLHGKKRLLLPSRHHGQREDRGLSPVGPCHASGGQRGHLPGS